jgi:hypothetical protein
MLVPENPFCLLEIKMKKMKEVETDKKLDPGEDCIEKKGELLPEEVVGLLAQAREKFIVGLKA